VCQHDPGEFDGTAYLADRSSTVQPTRIADDVLITSTGTLTHVCVIGIYVNFDGGASDCSVEADFDEVVDNYQVRVYLPESASNYVPGQLLGTYNTIVAENEEDPEYTDGYNFWRHQLELIPGGDPLVQLQANQVYFIEVSNNSQGGPVGCNWYWINAADGEGNNIFYQDLGAFYTAADANTSGATTNGDIALCMNVPFSTPDEPVRACCTGIGVCEDSTLPDCLDAGGTWQFGTLTCPINDACPAADNNQCSNAIQVSDGPFPFDNFGTTTTGETSELCEFAPTATAIGETGELWFQYTATCTGNALFSTCNREYFEDDVVSVYAHSNPANRGLCLCPGDPGFTLLECFDSGQDNPVNPTGCNTFGDQAEVYIPVTAGHCYTVRVSTFDDTAAPTLDNPFPENLGQLRITCGATGETFPVCGNGVIEAANGEQCDGTNADALCNNQCNAECRCPPPPCGNNIAEEALGQRCDGTDDDNCPGLCTEDCTCPPICGNGIKEGNEHCDDTDDALCPGDCNPPGPDGCTCDSTCGNGILEVGEACDGLAADNNCPGACTPPGPGGCQCPEPNCGNGVVEPLNNEECDGAATMELGALCDPAECRPPGDGAGECTCACGIAVVAPDPVTANTFGTCTVGNANCVVGGPACASGTCDTCGQVRSMSFVIPATSAGTDTAVRVKLTSLYDVVPPLPTSGVNPGPALAPFEGQYRYLNLIPGTLSRCCNPASNPTACNTSVTCTSDANCVGLGLNTKCMKNLCPDSPAFATFFRCARLGCTPEYRDWGSDFSGLVTYASGDSVVSDSTYHVAHLAASCAGNEAACGAASAEQMVKTERWGNVDCTTAVVPNATDIGFVVSKVKDAVGAFIKPRTQLREAIPNPLALVGAQDIARIVDAVKGRHYPDSFVIGACP
jgi:hypothetical protein